MTDMTEHASVILLLRYTTFCVSVHQLMGGIWVVSILGLLQIMLLWTFVYKRTHCMIPFIWNVQIRQIHRGRKLVHVCKEMESGRIQEWLLMRFLLGWWKYSQVRLCSWLHNFKTLLRNIEMYPLIGYIAWCVHYISINPFKNGIKGLPWQSSG